MQYIGRVYLIMILTCLPFHSWGLDGRELYDIRSWPHAWPMPDLTLPNPEQVSIDIQVGRIRLPAQVEEVEPVTPNVHLCSDRIMHFGRVNATRVLWQEQPIKTQPRRKANED